MREKKSVSRDRFLEIIDEVVQEDCVCSYCFLKTFIEKLHPSVDVLIQLKCIEKFKWEESKKEDEDIGWNIAGLRWAEEGFAKEFREVFDENLTVREIYERTKERVRLHHEENP